MNIRFSRSKFSVVHPYTYVWQSAIKMKNVRSRIKSSEELEFYVAGFIFRTWSSQNENSTNSFFWNCFSPGPTLHCFYKIVKSSSRAKGHEIKEYLSAQRQRINIMDGATMNMLYGWKGRVHKAIKVFEQNKMEYVRVCALPKTKSAMMKTIKKTTCNHDADIALTWVHLESSRKIVDVTIDAYIASIRRSFDEYQRIQVENAIALQPASGIPGEQLFANDENARERNVTIWVEGVVEKTINSHVRFIEQWREIISDAQKEASRWKSEHEKYLNKFHEIDKAQWRANGCNGGEDSVDGDDLDPGDSVDEEKADDSDDDDDDSVEDEDSVNQYGDNPFELLRMGMRVDEQAEKLFKLGTYVSAGKVLISSLKIANKIESIEAAAQEAGTASILGLTQANLHDREISLPNINHPIVLPQNETDTRTVQCHRSENQIVEEWRQETETTKADAIYAWYRLYHGSLSCANLEQI